MTIKRGRILGLAVSLVLFFSNPGNAALHLRGMGTITGGGVGQYLLIYDDVLDITWLDFTNPAGTWQQQLDWAEALEVTLGQETYDDWRLPHTLPVNGTTYDFTVSTDGSTDFGYNISAPGSAYPGSTGSEMAHLFYTTLGNSGGLQNTGPFQNLNGSESALYYSATEVIDPDFPNTLKAFIFMPYNGYQGCTTKNTVNHAMAVRPGNVAFDPLPEPEPDPVFLDHWVQRTHPDIATHVDLYDITFGNGRYVAVGPSGTIVTSTDGENWVERESGESGNTGTFLAIAYGNGVFVAVGIGDLIRISADGINWSDPGATLGTRSDIIFAEGKFFAVGSWFIYSSEDGVNWQYACFGEGFMGITYGDGMFVAVGTNDGNDVIYTSVDGVNWVDRSMASNVNMRGAAYGDGKFVVIGNDQSARIFYSDNGALWFEANYDLNYDLDAIAYGGGRFVAVGERMVAVSTDGILWTSHYIPIDRAMSVLYENEKFWVVGSDGAICSSTDAKSWSFLPSYPIPGVTFKDICLGNGTYVAVGWSGAIFASDDGHTWTSVDWADGNYNDFRGTQIYQVIHHNAEFIALGFYHRPGINDDYYPLTLTSPNGVDWTSHPISCAPDAFYRMVATQDQLVAVGQNGQIATSPDGVTWTAQNSPTGCTLRDVIFADGQYLAVGEFDAVGGFDTLVTSPDGVDWTRETIDIGRDFASIAFGNGVYVLIPSDMYKDFTYYTSDNGSDWQLQVASYDNQDVYSSFVRFLNGRFFLGTQVPSLLASTDGIQWAAIDTDTPVSFTQAVGLFGTTYLTVGNGLTVESSQNGTDWTVLRAPCTTDIKSVAYGNGHFIAVGGGGYWRSSPGAQWSAYTKDLGLSIAYGNGRFVSSSYYSTDGLHWTHNASRIDIYGIAFGNGVFVGYASNGANQVQLYISTDGDQWTLANASPLTSVYSIVYAGDRFLANVYDVQNGFMVSFDGMNWATLGTGTRFISVAHGNDMFLASTVNELYRSFDGINWTKSYTHPDPTVTLWQIAFGDGRFLFLDSKGQFYSTQYGIVIDQHYNSRRNFNELVYGGGTFVAVGPNGNIIQTIGDIDSDGLSDALEDAIPCLDSEDADSDDDGIPDGVEDADLDGEVDEGETNPCSADTDGDGIQDGTEIGLTLADIGPDTNTGVFIPDADHNSTTDPLDADSDDDGMLDGEEDENHNGRVDAGEHDPNQQDTIALPFVPLLLFE